MKDPKEIAEEAWSEWNTGLYNSELGFKQLIDHAIAAALQAEREDGCRRVNDAIGDRDPIIERLKADVTKLEYYLERANWRRCDIAACNCNGYHNWNPTREEIEEPLKTELEHVKAERDEAVEKEQGRWQEAIYQLLLKHAPDNKIDGAGCDSGDPLDFTLTEIGQAINHIVDEHDEAVKALEPFANAVDQDSALWRLGLDDNELSVRSDTHITLGHCRAARAVVEKVKQQ